MTITEATHALAVQPRQRRMAEVASGLSGDGMRLVDVMARVEPTWVEAVAVVQAVCAQLAPGEAAPALDAIRVSLNGDVSFPLTGPADDISTVKAVGRLLTGILRTGDCPMPVWEASERARRTPAAVGSARAVGAALTCFPAAQGPHELAQFVQSACTMAPPTARPATASFSSASLTARAGLLVLMVAMGGIGAGVSVGTLLATKTLGVPRAPLVALAEARR
ncbi:MAG: hypothetical protein IT181_21085 [Acidobacteria bacterium]|nr:hypothetical protein [Acidobacteriota bacterium]